MISGLQTRVAESVKVMAGSRSMATASVAEVEETRELLDAIHASAGGIQGMTYRIATAAEQQSQVPGDMDRNVVRIAHRARDNATGAGTIASASNQLGALAGKIGDLIQGFRTG